MENIWSTNSIIDEKRLGTLPFYSLLFFFLLLGVGMILFLWYPIEDRYSVLGRVYQKEQANYIECQISLSKISYLDHPFFYIKGKKYKYKIVQMQVISQKEGRFILQYEGKVKNSIVRIEWRGKKQTLGKLFLRTLRKE